LDCPAELPRKLLLDPVVIEEPVETLPIFILLPVNPRTPSICSFVCGFMVPIPVLPET
jgi:hypothetical protein